MNKSQESHEGVEEEPWEEALEDLLDASGEFGVWWCDKDNTRWAVTNNTPFVESLKDFIRHLNTKKHE